MNPQIATIIPADHWWAHFEIEGETEGKAVACWALDETTRMSEGRQRAVRGMVADGEKGLVFADTLPGFVEYFREESVDVELLPPETPGADDVEVRAEPEPDANTAALSGGDPDRFQTPTPPDAEAAAPGVVRARFGKATATA